MKIAICEAGTITPEQDAGSRAVADLVDGFIALGHDARIFAEDEQQLPTRVARFAPQVIVISRPGLFIRLHPLLRPLGVPIVYLAHDLHFVRVGLQSDFVTETNAGAAGVMRFVEQQCFALADLALLPTEEEASRVQREFPAARCIALDYFSMPEQPLPTRPPTQYRVAFVGGSNHAPNRDGVGWFIDEIWPTVREQRPDTDLVIAGRWPSGGGGWARVPGVTFVGEVPDVELDRILAGARVGIAPLRFGAGMKRKTLHYLSHGLPVIGTEFATEGLGDEHGDVPGVLRATTVAEWIEAFTRLDDDPAWTTLSAEASRFVRGRFSAARYRENLASVLSRLQ